MDNNNSYLPSSSGLPNQTLQVDQSSFPSYYQIDNTVFEQSPMTMTPPPPPQAMNIPPNQAMTINRPGEYKTNVEIICENYLKQYFSPYVTDNNVVDYSNHIDPNHVDPSLINRSGEAKLNYDDSDFSELDYLNSNDIQTTEQNLSALPQSDHFLSSDVVNLYSTSNWPLAAESLPPLPPPPPNGAVATINGEASSSKTKKKNWCELEHRLFLVGMDIFSKGNWKSIANKVIISKSHKQVASHAQKYFHRQTLSKEERKRPSIHDINTVDPVLLMQVRARLGLPPAPSLSMPTL